MNFWVGILLSALALLLVIIIFGTKLFFPYHRIIAITIYAIGWIPFLYSLSLRKHYILQYTNSVTPFFQIYWIHIIFAAIMLVAIFILLTLFPPTKSVFIGLSNEEISERLTEDETVLFYLNQRLSNNLETAQSNNYFNIDFTNISQTQKDNITNFWFEYIEVMFELDLLKERYKTFYQLNPISQKDLHGQAFKIGYLALLSQQYHTIKLTKSVTDPNVKNFLNQNFTQQGIERNTFTLLQEKITDTQELLKLNTGRAYYLLLNNKSDASNPEIDNYLAEISDSFTSYSKLIAKKPLNFLEKNSFKLWFPIQKRAAIQLSYIRTANRDYHISEKLIRKYKERFQPGDILLERREWHATNVGIPGFWTHNALYLGSINEMNKYFSGIPDLGEQTFIEYIEKRFPEAYAEFQTVDTDGNVFRVIEAKRPGVIFNSLEESTNADSVAVLRVKNISKSDQFKIVTQALQHLHKPYDYNFDFISDDAFVCSELIYKSYLDIPQLTISPEKFNGKLIFSPNQFAQKFDTEFQTDSAELDLVLFLDGNEKTGKAIEKPAKEFLDSWKRPKWHIAKDFIK